MPKKKPESLTAKWLGLAIASEKTALNNYLKYARQTKDKTGQDMFAKLAGDEFQHLTILEKQRELLLDGRVWRPVKIPPSPIEQITLLDDNNSTIAREMANSNESQALELAMKAEKNAGDFYLAQAKKTNNDDACAILRRLAEMENAHYQILQSELDSINKTGFWMGFREISMETE